MSVIINELDVVAPPAPPPVATTTEPPARRDAVGPTPFELRAVLRHLAARADRVRAD
jgi:hypothetical protein